MRSRGKWKDALRSFRSRPLLADANMKAGEYNLTSRTMSDSYCEESIPFASSTELFEAYTNTSGGVRTGKLMEHLDSLAGSISYKHLLGAVNSIANVTELGFYLVTASVDRYLCSLQLMMDDTDMGSG